MAMIAGEALNFTEADLTANQAGQLTVAQSNRMRLSALKNLLITLIFLAIAAYFGLRLVRSISASAPVIVPIVLAGFAILCLIAGYATAKRAYDVMSRASAGRIDVVEGKLSLIRHESTSARGGIHYYYLLIGEMRFTISRKQYNRLVDLPAGYYRLFYVPDMDVILSLERLEGANIPNS